MGNVAVREKVIKDIVVEEKNIVLSDCLVLNVADEVIAENIEALRVLAK